MKILSNKEYEELLQAQKDLKCVEQNNDSLRKDLGEYRVGETQLIKQIKRDCDNSILDKETEFKRRTADLESKISEETNKRIIAEEKSKMLEKAFDNLGFDVKDSKEIMSELIKALGVKNTVQVIK